MSILVVSDFSEGSFRASSTRAAVAAANRIDGNVDLLIAGKGARAASDAAAKLHGVTRVLAADSDSLDHLSPERASAYRKKNSCGRKPHGNCA